MIAKTLKTAVATTAAVGALVAPGAMTVAPQIANMACQYPDSVVTNTTIASQRTFERGEVGRATVTVVSDAGVPNGDLRVLVVQDGDTFYNSGRVPLPNDGTKGFDLPDKLKPGKYTIRAKFFGQCKFSDSSDRFRFEVQRKG